MTITNSVPASAKIEAWRAIPGWGGYYEASSLGQIRSSTRIAVKSNGVAQPVRGRLMRLFTNNQGRRTIVLSRAGTKATFKVHVLVALTFIGPRPDGLDVCHSDGNRLNNSEENLRYDTASANSLDSVRHRTHSSARRGQCPKGHAYDATNTVYRNARRHCGACATLRRQKAKWGEVK